ncbi:PTS sugar transporter subunit IIB [Agromyces humatus]|uniref:PTS lactose transporter subunit IIB n=1 Tax=Agromyces humatus TaxID=279573 RepID=A0ABP4X2M0_9MICO|nr:PTS IIB subunit [Agromyces humatus]
MRIIVVCGAGASSTFIAHRIRRAAADRGLSVRAQASSASGLDEILQGADVLLVGEHLAEQLVALRERAVAASVPIAILPSGASSAPDGEEALDLALATAGARS